MFRDMFTSRALPWGNLEPFCGTMLYLEGSNPEAVLWTGVETLLAFCTKVLKSCCCAFCFGNRFEFHDALPGSLVRFDKEFKKFMLLSS